MVNPYEDLHVANGAPLSEIKTSFSALALKSHPDEMVKASDEEKAKAEEQFKSANAAYEFLTNSKQKKRLDENIVAQKKQVDGPVLSAIATLISQGIEELGSLAVAICGEDLLEAARGTSSDAPRAHTLKAVVRPILLALRALASSSKKNDTTPLRTIVEFNLVARARVIFSTVSSAGRSLLAGEVFNVVVVDEAAMCEEASSLVVLRPETERMILVGDPKQLPATVFSAEAKGAGYERSLMERLQFNGSGAVLLNLQHRMHPDISRWPNHQFYGGKLEDAPCTQSAPPRVWKGSSHAFDFIHVDQGSESRDEGGSIYNKTEAAVVEALISSVRKLSPDLSIGVVTPYRAQRGHLERVFSGKGVDVNTVDGFQGQERDVIIFTAVRTNNGGNIGFLKDVRRMNVALTRAKRKLIVVGDSTTLKKRNADWRSLVRSAEDRGSFFPLSSSGASSLCDQPVVRKALKEDQLQRFLRKGSFDKTKWSSNFVEDCGRQLRDIAEQDKPRVVLLFERLYGLLNGLWPKRLFAESFVPDVERAQDIFVLRVQRDRIFYTVELQTKKEGVVVQQLRFWSVIRDDFHQCAKVITAILYTVLAQVLASNSISAFPFTY
jgi:hypothetical protein